MRKIILLLDQINNRCWQGRRKIHLQRNQRNCVYFLDKKMVIENKCWVVPLSSFSSKTAVGIVMHGGDLFNTMTFASMSFVCFPWNV